MQKDYWQKNITYSNFLVIPKRHRNLDFADKCDQHNKALYYRYNSPSVQAMKSCLWSLTTHRQMTTWSKIFLSAGKASVKLHVPHRHYQQVQQAEQTCSNQQHAWHCTKAEFLYHSSSLRCQGGHMGSTTLLRIPDVRAHGSRGLQNRRGRRWQPQRNPSVQINRAFVTAFQKSTKNIWQSLLSLLFCALQTAMTVVCISMIERGWKQN